ncbi:LytR/AlgR family response regulator transcription factor [Pseudobacter ginsenosidimutans]|uniref:LytTR family two component transcriptional regulator n=1 Tax=Pseudobacter ginsenosidimutans TaxID=661488 RepID=A0A4Q7MZA8_9BACT|nr:LytTR family DNA-binding domain-containing protein [Pseudobacter ginsenosidimutans]QEC42870.1 response regulator transcription factor [Pseudobacter ginsenosidimutans]RZS74222.1 LytTR family two component transcriptional regulator [Pseudobacter ginsenosidimutans]
MKPLQCIAVDDEPLALNLVCKFIEQTPFLSLSGKYKNAITALQDLKTLEQVDLVFMDIHMPDLDGIELAKMIKAIQGEHAPKLVFTTAYNQYAIEGYKLEALDYLLKPFNYDDFLRVALKAKSHSEKAANTVPAPTADHDAIFFKVEYRWIKVMFAEILYIEGVKDYVKVHLINGKPIITLNSLKNLEAKLPSTQFMRLNRSTIVSIPRITAVTKTSVQINELVIPVGENYRESFGAFIRDWID